MVFRPARRRPLTMASFAPSADTGSGLTASASSPSATMRPWTCRVSVRAQIAVEAIAALTAKPCTVSAPHSSLQQRGLAAEQMGAAGDVEKQAMRRIERHQRREAVAPVGDVVERLGVGRLVGVDGPSDAGQIARALASGRPIARPARRRHRRAHRSAARCSPWRRRRWGRLGCFTSPACGGGRIASEDAMRVGETLSARTVSRGSTPTPTLPRKREREPHRSCRETLCTRTFSAFLTRTGTHFA